MVTADLLRQIEAARKAGESAERTEPAARQARYNPLSRELEVELRDGRRISVSVDLIEGLQGASDEALSGVEVTPAGTGLHWEALDADVSVPFLVKGVYGTRAWMARLGRRGGKVSSPAKAAAARENGRKGGRPRKSSASQPEEAPVLSTDCTVRLRLPRTLYRELQEGAREEGVTLEVYLLALVAQGAPQQRLHLELQNVCQRIDRMEHRLLAWGWQIETQVRANAFERLRGPHVVAQVREDFQRFLGA